MKIFGLVLGAGILLAPAAHARTWVIENIAQASCVTTPANDFTTPEAFIDQIRSQGVIPDVKATNGADGTLSSVVISFQLPNGQGVHVTFFTSMDGCQAQLKQDIADGTVTDPNALR